MFTFRVWTGKQGKGQWGGGVCCVYIQRVMLPSAFCRAHTLFVKLATLCLTGAHEQPEEGNQPRRHGYRFTLSSSEEKTPLSVLCGLFRGMSVSPTRISNVSAETNRCRAALERHRLATKGSDLRVSLKKFAHQRASDVFWGISGRGGGDAFTR